MIETVLVLELTKAERDILAEWVMRIGSADPHDVADVNPIRPWMALRHAMERGYLSEREVAPPLQHAADGDDPRKETAS